MICKKFIHEKVCKHKSESVYECEHFADGTIKNQYDRIRNMSIDEMADFICDIYADNVHREIRVNGEWLATKDMEKWLESEVTE